MSAAFENAGPLLDRELAWIAASRARDFLNGAALTIGAAAMPASALHSDAQAAEPKIIPATIHRSPRECVAAIPAHLKSPIAFVTVPFGRLPANRSIPARSTT